jgi:ParB-like chromosome segregation protein Spo0J
MAKNGWQSKTLPIASLHLDAKNPRLGRETTARAPREIIQYLFDHDKALDLAQSIVARGYFPNEPLLAVRENDRYVVVEGNRRLAALKALKEPGLLEGSVARQVEKLARKLIDPQSIASVPVVIAPNRRITDRQIAGKHIGTPVLPWRAENRASFILEKLEEGYDNAELLDELGFSAADIQAARQTRAIADMARSLPLPEEIKAKLENRRSKLFTTLGRVFESTVGREYLHVEPNVDHGLKGTTSSIEFAKGFSKLVTDVALNKQSSRTLNTNVDIRKYFESWDAKDRPKKMRGSFIPADLISGSSTASSPIAAETRKKPRNKQVSQTILPTSFKVRFGADRLVDIRGELTKLRRDKFPNAGSVLLRVFFELAALDYLKRTGDLTKVTATLKAKGALRHDTPTIKQLVPTLISIVKAKLPTVEADKVEKAIKYNPAAPFSISDLHSFVHQSGEWPGERDIQQFWLRTEPLFRMMLEEDVK